jgi:DNA-binding XRE family transcriptional regulator
MTRLAPISERYAAFARLMLGHGSQTHRHSTRIRVYYPPMSNANSLPHFGERLRQLRAASGLSQSQLAQRSGVSVRTLQKYEYGTFEPTWGNVVALANGLGVPVEAFRQPGKKFKKSAGGG